MSKRILMRFLVPALLIAGAVLVWALWPNGARQTEVPTVAPMGLVALALVVTFQSFLEEAFDIPIAIWVIGVIMLAIGIALFFSNATGVLSILALIAVAAFFFFW